MNLEPPSNKLPIATATAFPGTCAAAYVSPRGKMLAEKRYPATLRGIAALILDLAALGSI